MFHSRRLSEIAVFICASVLLIGIEINASESVSIMEPSMISPDRRDDHDDTPDSATIIQFPHENDYIIDPPGDIDWYRIHLNAGTLILICTERINDSELDPRAMFYGPHDESGTDVDPITWIDNDDDGHGNLQPEIRLPITETGYYFLRISYYQNIPAGGICPERKEDVKAETGEYRLFILDLPDQSEIMINPSEFDFALAPDETSEQYLTISNQGNIDLHVMSITDDQVSWLDETPSDFVLPPDSSLDVTVSVNAIGMTEGSYPATISITSDDPDDGIITVPVVLTLALPDSNESPESAVDITVPHQGDYALAPAEDVDWYRLHLEAGTTWMIYSERILGSLVDPEVWFFGPHSETGEDVDSTDWIANNDDGHGDRQFEIIVNITETGYYYLRIASFLDDPSSPAGGNPGSQKALTGAYRLIIAPSTDVDDTLPTALNLFSVSPNPANDMIRLSFELPEDTHVKIGIYDLTGRCVQIAVNENMIPRLQVRTLSTQALSAGSYVVRLRTEKTHYSQPLLIVP